VRERIKALGQRIDALTLRERTLLLLTVVAVLFGIWYAALYRPLLARANAAEKSVTQLQKHFQRTTRELQKLVGQSGRSPNDRARARLASLKSRIADNDRKLTGATAGLIPPARMGTVLKTLLLEEPGLKLVSVDSEAARPLVKGQKNGPLFTHGLTLTFDGRYGAALDYLRKVEALPWQLDWDSIRIITRDYPKNRITLQVHTISFSEAWLGT